MRALRRPPTSAWRPYLVFLFAVTVAAPAFGANAQPGPPRDLDAWVARTMKAFDVPGMSLAIVKDGKVVLAKGYGVRKLGAPAPVGPDTLFAIGSNTKAFTTASLAMLVDEGKLSWDDRVVDRLPGFRMYDPYVTQEMRVRDLLTHRSGLGLGAGDLLFFPPTTYTRDEILYRLRFLKPATSFRSAYAYDNLLYMVAGQIIPAVTGKSWDDFVRERIFVPLGMTSTSTKLEALTSGGDAAAPHSRVGDAVRAVSPQGLENAAPAGSINSSVAEMARWMIVQLDHGSLAIVEPRSTKRLFSADRSREMWTPQTILPVTEPPPGLEGVKTNFASYALGWGLREIRGHTMISHTGGVIGFVSRVTLVPDLNLGIVVLTNQEEGSAFNAVNLHVLDSYLGVAPTDWITALEGIRKKEIADAAKTEREAASARAAGPKPSLALDRYAGKYRDSWRDDVTIALEGDRLVLRFGRTDLLVGDLEHWQHDTFIARWRERSLHADAYVTFSLEPDGAIRDVRMRAVSPLTDFSFDFQDLLFTRAPQEAGK